MSTYRFTLFVAACATLGAALGKGDWLVNALAGAMLAAGAWLTILVCLVVTSLISRTASWLARLLGFGHSQARCSSYASPTPRRSPVSAQRRYTAPAGTGYSGAGYAAAAAGAGVAAWGDMHDPLAVAQAQQLAQMQEPQRMFPGVNPTTGATMTADSPIDDAGHIYCDPTLIYEAPSYDYSNNSCGGGGCGGFDF